MFEVWLDPHCSFKYKFCNSYLSLGWKIEDLTKASDGGIKIEKQAYQLAAKG
jgi:hypothetical protein